MVVSSPKNQVQVLTTASRGYLATQRRLCVTRGKHWFDLRASGRLTVDAVKNFFESCDDIASCNVSPVLRNGDRKVQLIRK